IYNYNIKLKKYNPKAVFSTFFSIVKMEQVAKSGGTRMCEGMVLCYTFHRQDKTIPHNREVWK
ncbi:MAG: hypothetical protein KH281_11910, partial [Lachnospiraceae bacterium]|nr:hypothetical protein [Lachnospiraceae bacterium]